MTVLPEQLTRNLDTIRERIAAAARRSGRDAGEITLAAVTKYVGVEVAGALAQAGCRDLAESRPQELWHKTATWQGPEVRWHFVGHLQRNKVRRTLPAIHLLHSGDSLTLLAEVDQQSRALQRTLPVLLEVNVSGDETKHGFHPDELGEAYRSAARLEHVRLVGLMAMASREGDLDQARQEFRQLRLLRDELVQLGLPGAQLDHLSMGMSGDFEVAVEEGATIVRVGSALFDGVVR
ncbi:MAG: YggS family pyridoxal phosphate-dependent enzyme [Pirellulaceae bacterium]